MPHHQPSRDTWQYVSGWRCPLCLYTMYEPVVVRTPRGKEYCTEFYQCGRCTNMFRDPARYTRLGVPVHRWMGDVGPKTLAEAHDYWRDDAMEKKNG